MLRLLPFPVACLLLVLPAAAQPLADTPSLGLGLVRQGEVDDSGDAPIGLQGVCLTVLTPTRLHLAAAAWSPGDVLTLRAFDAAVGRWVSASTDGEPPMATIDYTSPSSCIEYEVEGTRVAHAVAYTVVHES